MADVFISYSRQDTDFVKVLHKALEASNKEAWIDWQGIAPTTEWWKEIEAGIEASDNFLFVIGPGSVKSKYCLQEIDHALKHNKRIIPVLRRSADMPKAISHIQRVAFLEDDPFDTAFAALVETIDTDLEHKKTHTRLQVRAIEWEQVNMDGSLLLRGSELEKAEQWLLQAAGKDPRPTELQGEYIAASRKASTGRQRTLVAALGSLLALALVGGGFGYWQFGRASRALAESEQAKAAETEQREIAEARQQEAETERSRAEEALKEAEQQRQLAQLKQQEAEEALQQAETAQQAETQQRQRAEQALIRAEEGETEALRQANIAQEQTVIAEQQKTIAQENEAAAVAATRQAEIQRINADFKAESFRVENMMASGLNFKALLAALKLNQQIKGHEEGEKSLQQVAQVKALNQDSNQKVVNANNPVRPDAKWQAISVLREAYFFDGYMEHNFLEGHGLADYEWDHCCGADSAPGYHHSFSMNGWQFVSVEDSKFSTSAYSVFSYGYGCFWMKPSLQLTL